MYAHCTATHTHSHRDDLVLTPFSPYTQFDVQISGWVLFPRVIWRPKKLKSMEPQFDSAREEAEAAEASQRAPPLQRPSIKGEATRRLFGSKDEPRRINLSRRSSAAGRLGGGSAARVLPNQRGAASADSGAGVLQSKDEVTPFRPHEEEEPLVEDFDDGEPAAMEQIATPRSPQQQQQMEALSPDETAVSPFSNSSAGNGSYKG